MNMALTFLVTFGILFSVTAQSTTSPKPQVKDSEILQWIAKQKVGIIHTISKGMPLSVKSLKNLEELKHSMKFTMLVLEDPNFPFGDEVKSDGIFPIQGFISEHGGFLHFPAIMVFKNGQQCGGQIPGYKSLEAYESLIKERVNHCHPAIVHPLPEKAKKALVGYILEKKIPISRYRYFYKMAGEETVMLHTGTRGGLNFSGKHEMILPGAYDHFPSPDLEIYAVPEPMRFFDLKPLLANPYGNSSSEPLFTDETATDAYESIGILERDQKTANYRVITGWGRTGAYRDYQFDLMTRTFTPINTLSPFCSDMSFSLPLVSKDGLYVGLHDNIMSTSKVMSLGRDGTGCTEVINLGMTTGKISFSADQSKIAFMAIDPSSKMTIIYVVDLKTGAWTEVTRSDANDLFFPDFTPSGNVSVMEVESDGPSANSIQIFKAQ